VVWLLAIHVVLLEVSNMKGTIRLIVGLLLVMGAAGGLDNATDAQILPLMGIAILGLFSMYSATKAMNR